MFSCSSIIWIILRHATCVDLNIHSFQTWNIKGHSVIEYMDNVHNSLCSTRSLCKSLLKIYEKQNCCVFKDKGSLLEKDFGTLFLKG